MKPFGITSYGFYLPKYRITVEEIARNHGKAKEEIEGSLLVTEKTIAGADEDTATMAVSAGTMALRGVDRGKIDMVLVGSETHPYAVKPTSTIVGEWLSIDDHHYLAYDTQFACKAATGAMLSAFSAVKAGDVRNALICGADKATGKPGDALEYTAASGATAFVIGTDELIAEAVAYGSYSSDTPDFWRRHGIAHPSHGGRFTGKPSYFRHIYQAGTTLMEKVNMKPEDFTFGVFHMPNGRFPLEVSKALGFTQEQIQHSLVVKYLGNSYASSALMGLVATLEQAKAGDTILFVSYGSGAGSDAIVFKVTDAINKKRQAFMEQASRKAYVSYPKYLKMLGVLK
jgi:hydroxymethylglutaryl-CoA synthase